jgi:curved DNA-binding protein CbpA
VSVRSDVLLWAQRVIARRDAPPHQILEIDEGVDLAAAQEAFHKIARVAHPDLHRGSLTDEDLALVAAAYARVSAAYQELRRQAAKTGRMPPLALDPPPPRTRTSSARPFGLQTRAPSTQPLPQRTRPPSAQPPSPRASGTMDDAPRSPLAAGSSPDAIRASTPGGISPKALVHYRKAELNLRRGELKEAVLQLKLAVVSDPHSAFLRTALAEVEAVVVRK